MPKPTKREIRAAARQRKAAQRQRDNAMLAPYGWTSADDLIRAIRAGTVKPPTKP